MSFSEYVSPLVGRLVLAWFFTNRAVYCIHHWADMIAMLSGRGLPVAPVILALALIVISLGVLSLVLGFHARHGAMILFALMVAGAVMLHDFWNAADASGHAGEYALFIRDIAIAGGLLLLVGQGAGPFAFDNRQGGGKKRR